MVQLKISKEHLSGATEDFWRTSVVQLEISGEHLSGATGDFWRTSK